MEDYSASDTDGAWILWSGSLVLARCVEAHAVAAASSAAGVDGSVAAARTRRYVHPSNNTINTCQHMPTYYYMFDPL